MSLFNFIFHNLSQLCKDGVMSDHSMFVFILGPIAGGPAMTLWRLWWDTHLFFGQQLHLVNFLLLLMSTFLSLMHTQTRTQSQALMHTHTHTHTHFSHEIERASF